MRNLFLCAFLIVGCTQDSLPLPSGGTADLSSALPDTATVSDAAMVPDAAAFDSSGCTPIAIGAWTWHGGEIPGFATKATDSATPPTEYGVDLFPPAHAPSGYTTAYMQASATLTPQTPGYTGDVGIFVTGSDAQTTHGMLETSLIYDPSGRCLVVPKSAF